VDSSTRPVEPWWNPSYAAKRNVLVVNQDADALPAGYSVLLRFTASTIPPASAIYNASQAPVKGDDIRIVYNNQAELSRFIPMFTPNQVDIWFRLQAPIGGLGSDGASYQLYSGNTAPTPPPADVADVMPPPKDGNTIALWHLQEHSGST